MNVVRPVEIQKCQDCNVAVMMNADHSCPACGFNEKTGTKPTQSSGSKTPVYLRWPSTILDLFAYIAVLAAIAYPIYMFSRPYGDRRAEDIALQNTESLGSLVYGALFFAIVLSLRLASRLIMKLGSRRVT